MTNGSHTKWAVGILSLAVLYAAGGYLRGIADDAALARENKEDIAVILEKLETIEHHVEEIKEAVQDLR